MSLNENTDNFFLFFLPLEWTFFRSRSVVTFYLWHELHYNALVAGCLEIMCPSVAVVMYVGGVKAYKECPGSTPGQDIFKKKRFIKRKYTYFSFGGFLAVDFCQKIWGQIKLPWKLLKLPLLFQEIKILVLYIKLACISWVKVWKNNIDSREQNFIIGYNSWPNL